jgi:hypothetical protein
MFDLESSWNREIREQVLTYIVCGPARPVR